MSTPFDFIRHLARWASATEPQAPPAQPPAEAEGNAGLAALSAERDPAWPNSEEAQPPRLSIDG